jgi:hypothetical protein
MKKSLLKAFVMAALALSAALPIFGQTSALRNPTVKNNFNQKIKRITLHYKKSTSTDWEPTVGNYWLPADAVQLRFTIELYQSVRNIRVRLELRQLCQLGIQPDIEVTREGEFFASKTPLAGEVLPGPKRIYEAFITVHPPEGGVEHPQPHCFQNPDHLGEGPYEASMWLSSGDDTSILGSDDTLHLTYTHSFETTSNSRFIRLQAKEFLKQLTPHRRGRRRPR